MVTTSGNTPNLEPALQSLEPGVGSNRGTHGPTVINDDSIPNNIAGNENNPNNKGKITEIFQWGVPKETDVEQIKIAEALGSLYVSQADYSLQGVNGCMEGTREQVLDEINGWIQDLEGAQVLWLTGMLGTGKTAISSTVCSRVSDNPDIVFGGSFFCSRSRDKEPQYDVRCIVPTLALVLARQSATFAEALAAELERHPKVLDQQIGTQVKALLYTPLLALKSSPAPIVFVIDALDECGPLTSDGAPNEMKTRHIVSELVKALVQFSPSSEILPIKLLVTSRPEGHIRSAFASTPAPSKILRLSDIDKRQIFADIQLYVTATLDELAPDLLTENDINTLVHFANGVFIVAATTVKQIIQPDPDGTEDIFETLFDVPRSLWDTVHLDDMYTTVLDNAAGIGKVESGARQRVLAALLSTPTTLSVSSLVELLELRRSQVHASLSDLHAVVFVPNDDDDAGLRPLHSSFASYLFRRAPDHIRIAESLGHEILANRCFDVMAEDLHFNMSQSWSSFEENLSAQPDGVCFSLEYACLHWAYHVSGVFEASRSDPDTKKAVRSQLEQKMNDVFRPRLLFWIEMMSVLRQIQRATAMLLLAATSVESSELSRFFCDANSFSVSSRTAIERSTPHIYLSALPFTDGKSLVYQEFAPLCTGLVEVDVCGIARRAGGHVMTLAGHEDAVSSVEYSPDGRLLASGSADGTVRIWDMRTGGDVMTLVHHNDGAVRSVAFAPNIQKIASGTESGIVCVWSTVAAGAPPHRLRGHSGPVSSVLYSSNGTHLASASFDATVRLWNTGTNQQVSVLRGRNGKVYALAFSSDSLTLASGSEDGTIRIWNVMTTRCKSSHRYDAPIRSISFLAGDNIVVATGNRVVLRTGTEAKIETLYSGSDTVLSIRSASDGKHVVMACANSVSVMTLPESISTAGVSVTCVGGHNDSVRSVSISPDCLYVASASDDGTARVWNAGSKLEDAPLMEQKVTAACTHAASQQANILRATDEATWDRVMSDSRALKGHSSYVPSIVVSPDGAFIVSGSADKTIRVWDASTGAEKLTALQKHTHIVQSVCISSDGRTIASASYDKTVRLWNARTGQAIGQPMQCSTVVLAVAFSPDGRWIVSASDDLILRIWDVSTQRCSNVGPMKGDSRMYAVVISPDGRLIAAGTVAGRIHIWDKESGQPTRQLLLPQKNSRARSLCFSPDGTRILAGAEQPTAIIWEVATGRQILVLQTAPMHIFSVAYSPDGQFICTGANNGAVCLWDVATGRQIVTLHGHGGSVLSVTFTPDGRSIVSGSSDTTIRIWKLIQPPSSPTPTSTPASVNSEIDPVAALKSAVLDDEWYKGPSGELLLWVPPEYHQHLNKPPTEPEHVILGAGDDGWHYGESWNSCWRAVA